MSMETECDYVIPKRSYVYQASKEVKIVKDLGVEREKIDSPSNERSIASRKWLFSGKDDNDMSDCLLDVLFPHEDNVLCFKTQSTKCAQDVSDLKLFDLVCEGNGNLHTEENATPVWETFCAELGLCHLDVDANLSEPSTTARLDPHIKIQDAFMELESHHNPSLARKKITSSIETGVLDFRQKNTSQQPLLPYFSTSEETVECNKVNLIENAKDVISSPVHLSGILKQENRGDDICFEFFTHGQVDILSAKTCRPENAADWAYTFHSTKKKNNSGIWSIKDRHKKSSILVGRMCTSCQLLAEVNNDGYLQNFMQMEFVLYDTDQDKVKVFTDKNSAQHMKVSCNQQCSRKPDNSVYPENFKHESSNLLFNNGLYVSHPWKQKDLFPSLEIAAIVIQVPVETPYLEWEKGGLFISKWPPQFAPAFVEKKVQSKCKHSININVIAPSGRHGIPHEGGPSPLIERWRSGGQCDCGGWDTGCPILVLENNEKKTDDYSNGCFNHSVKLDIQGSKNRTPALTVTAQAEGEYLVEFHAQFSAVQAFAISVAVLHCLERNTPMLHSNALRLLLKDELKQLLNTATEDVMKGQEEMRYREPIAAKFILDPPFSPIRRA